MPSLVRGQDELCWMMCDALVVRASCWPAQVHQFCLCLVAVITLMMLEWDVKVCITQMTLYRLIATSFDFLYWANLWTTNFDNKIKVFWSRNLPWWKWQFLSFCIIFTEEQKKWTFASIKFVVLCCKISHYHTIISTITCLLRDSYGFRHVNTTNLWP